MADAHRSSRKKLLARGAFAAILLASIGLNVGLGQLAAKGNKEHAAVRLDPLGLDIYPVGPDPAVPDSSRRVVFFGDSRAQNWPPPTVEGVQFVNRGIGHQTTAQVIERFDRHVAALKPRAIVVEVGVNDLKQIAVFPERRAEIVERCRKNIDAIVARSRALGAAVVLVTVFPVGAIPLYRRPFWREEVRGAVSEVNAHIRAQARDGVVVFDAEPLLVDASGVTRGELSIDFLHLNTAGYAALNGGLAPILTKLVP